MFTTLPQLRNIFTSEEETRKDILQIVVSDFHSGSNYALFVNREWQGRKTSHIPRAKQIQIRSHFEKFCAEVANARQGKKVKLIHNGDAIDGDHHHSGDVCSVNELEQADIHIELMNELQKRINWQAGDELYYTKGTQTHVHEYENYIGRELNAVPDGEFYSWDFLQLTSNGAVSWFTHHGPSRGKGANEGNPVVSWLKGIYHDAIKDNIKVPDIIYTGHVHDPTYSVYAYREINTWKVMHGIITPSWQMKTDYAWQVAAASRNKIGGVIHEIKSDGTITIPRFCVMEPQ